MRIAAMLTIALIVLGFVIGGYVWLSHQSHTGAVVTPTTSPPPAGPITITGQIVCLPHLNTNGPQTLECAYGLKDGSARYFSLRNSRSDQPNITTFPTNTTVEIQGSYTPQADSTYQSLGVIDIIQITPLSPSPTPSAVLPTKYITGVDWPPVKRIENQAFSCTEAGKETDRAGQTKQAVINNHTYCVTKETEGAAGSIYTHYAYARAKVNQTEIFTFSLRFVQCDNYPEPEKSACQTERQNFNVDNFVDTYIQSQ